MDDFATYILNEEDHVQKMIIAYYLSKKADIFFDKTIILKTEIVRIFIDYAKLNVDRNTALTAMLLCNCKKIEDIQKKEKLETYAKRGAEYLSTLGFSKRFCKICEGINRYSGIEPREPESDVLELVDQFIGIILDSRFTSRITTEEAFVILKERNLKDSYNRYLNDFQVFLQEMEKITIKGNVDVPVIKKLILLHNTSNIKSFISSIGNEYDEKINLAIEKSIKSQIKTELKENTKAEDKAIFTKEIADKILNHESVYRIEEDE